MKTTIRRFLLFLLAVVPLYLIVAIAPAAPIIEPTITKFTPDPDNKPSPMCAGGAPSPCVPDTKGPQFNIGSGTGWPPVWNNSGLWIYDIHIQIEGPADAKWADVNGDGKVGASDIFPEGGTVSADGKAITLIVGAGGPIKPGEDPSSGKAPPADSFKPHFVLKDAGEDGIDVRASFTTPEPSTLLLLGSALAGLGGFAWRRRRRK